MKLLCVIILSSISLFAIGQVESTDLPFREIEASPENYTAGTVAARMIDGLGFRFYWATEGLNEDEIKYSPGENMRTIEATADHIYGMTVLIANAVLQESEQVDAQLDFLEKRKETLIKLKAVRDKLAVSDESELEKMKIKFSPQVEYPFWNLINGPIADAIWHCGQIASFRRSAGNPFDANVSLFNGKLRTN